MILEVAITLNDGNIIAILLMLRILVLPHFHSILLKNVLEKKFPIALFRPVQDNSIKTREKLFNPNRIVNCCCCITLFGSIILNRVYHNILFFSSFFYGIVHGETSQSVEIRRGGKEIVRAHPSSRCMTVSGYSQNQVFEPFPTLYPYHDKRL